MELKDWIARTELQVDPLTLLFWLVTILIVFAVGMAFGRRAQRRIERQSQARRIIPENADQVPIARWIEEGKQLFNLWQERVAQVTELQSRLDAMAQEIGQLRAQVGQIDNLRTECLRLSQAGEALLLERDQLRSVLGRISELAQRAGQIRPGATGTVSEAGP